MNYFDLSAETYLQRSRSGGWKWIRETESRAVLRALNPKVGERILDVGCGPGYYALKIQGLGASVVGIDRSSPMIEKFRGLGLPGFLGDFEAFQFDESFDKILIAGSGEFMHDPKSILKQIDKLLAPGGVAVILAPRKNIFGQLYRIWHRSHGCKLKLHDYKKISKIFPALRISEFKMITPMSSLISFTR